MSGSEEIGEEARVVEHPEPLEILRSGPVGVSSPAEMESARNAHLSWLEDQVAELPLAKLRYQTRQRGRFLVAGGAFFAAAAATLAFLFVPAASKVSGPLASTKVEMKSLAPEAEQFATLVSGRVRSDTMEVLSGSRLSLSSRVATGSDEGASLVAAGVYELELGRDSEVSLTHPQKQQTGTETVVRLHRGSAKLSVSPLPKGSTFAVIAPDLTVTVVGTAFLVETREGAATCVRVTEGRVVVDRKGESRTLTAGQEWECDEQEKRLEGEDRQKEPLEERKKLSLGSTLAEENALLALGLSAERKGDKDRAKRAYGQLLSRYPKSAFALDARAGLDRLKRAREPE